MANVGREMEEKEASNTVDVDRNVNCPDLEKIVENFQNME